MSEVSRPDPNSYLSPDGQAVLPRAEADAVAEQKADLAAVDGLWDEPSIELEVSQQIKEDLDQALLKILH